MDARKKLMGATVALSDRKPLDIAAVADFLNASFADLLGIVRPLPSRDDARSGRHVLEFDDGKVVLALSEGAIAWADLTSACEMAWLWPEATSALTAHCAKIEVSLYGTRLEPVRAALITTAFTAAVAANSSAAGIRWNAGLVVQSPEHFVEAALHLPTGHLPVECWVHLGLAVDAGRTTVVTSGMTAFGLPEIEAVDVAYAPRLVVGRVTSFAEYLLRNGSVVQDGHAIGYSDQEKILVRRRPSWFRLNCEAYKLEFKKLLVPV